MYNCTLDKAATTKTGKSVAVFCRGAETIKQINHNARSLSGTIKMISPNYTTSSIKINLRLTRQAATKTAKSFAGFMQKVLTQNKKLNVTDTKQIVSQLISYKT